MNKIANGDELAFRELFHQYWDNIYGVAFMLTKSQTIAEDMVQEIFVKIWTKRSDLVKIDHFRNYLFIISRNHILSALRKNIRHQPFVDSLVGYFKETDATPEKQLLKKETTQLIHRAIDQLPEQITTNASILKLSEQRNIKQADLCVVRSYPDPSGRHIVNEDDLVTSVGITRIVLLLLHCKLPADEGVLLALVPIYLSQLWSTGTCVDADQEFLIGVGYRT